RAAPADRVGQTAARYGATHRARTGSEPQHEPRRRQASTGGAARRGPSRHPPRQRLEGAGGTRTTGCPAAAWRWHAIPDADTGRPRQVRPARRRARDSGGDRYDGDPVPRRPDDGEGHVTTTPADQSLPAPDRHSDRALYRQLTDALRRLIATDE